MSHTVRDEVSPKSHEWGYRLGSVYIRKVHFRDLEMIHQIESKVVNRLRQVTSAIKQDGANQVSIVTSTAERKAAVEFAKAAAIQPQLVGESLQKISQEPETADAMFTVLEIQKLLRSNARLTLVPQGGGLLTSILASKETTGNPQGSTAQIEIQLPSGIAIRVWHRSVTSRRLTNGDSKIRSQKRALSPPSHPSLAPCSAAEYSPIAGCGRWILSPSEIRDVLTNSARHTRLPYQ